MIAPFTQEYLKSIFDCDPKTGILIWKWRVGKRSQLNNRDVGKVAGHLRDDGYVRVVIDGHQYYAHIIVWFYFKGEWVPEIDHNNLVRNDNKLDNLRPCTRSQNKSNARVRSDSLSGYKGIQLRQNGSWRVRICKDGNRVTVGHFKKLEDAISAYKEAADKYHQEFARFD